MNNPAIQQALIELEENLSKIESARTQVNTVAEKSEQLISSFTKSIDAINAINENISFDKEAINSHIDDSLDVFKSSLLKIVNKSKKDVEVLVSTIGSNESRFEQSLNNTIDDTVKKLNQLVLEMKSNTETLKKEMDNEINTLSETIKNANNQINSFVNAVSVLEKKIDAIDFKDELKQIELNINSKHKQILIVGIVLIVGLIAIAILK